MTRVDSTSNPKLTPVPQSYQSPQNNAPTNSPSRTSNGNLSLSPRVSEGDLLTNLSSDKAIPSIESDMSSLAGGNYTTSTSSHSRTPSLSFTPPASTSQISENVNNTTYRHGINSIESRLGKMRLLTPTSSLGMSDVGLALEDVAQGSGGLSTLKDSENTHRRNTSVSSRRSSRRRSGSQINFDPHNVDDEESPQDRFNQPDFQLAFQDAKNLMSELEDVLESSNLHDKPDSAMQKLHQKAKELARFRCPSTRTVGFVGDSGVGKSSLINSLLDYRGLARTSNSGAACTCVVTEYHYYNGGDFAIEVELFSIQEIMDQLSELLQCYRQYHLGSDDEDNKYYEEKANLAQDTFRVMFRGRLNDERFLIDSSEESILDTLKSWAEALAPSGITGRQIKSTLEEFSALLMQLTSEQNSAQEPAHWPYIKKIKVYLNAHILSKGLILVDLPGLRDLNSARRNITERYILECNDVFAVCHIGRATTDVGVAEVINVARQAQLSSVNIVCTKSDDINAEEAKKDSKGAKAAKIQQYIDTIAADQLQLKSIEEEQADYVYEDDELTDEEKNEILELSKRARKIQKRISNHEFELKKFLISTRNADIIKKLIAHYQDQVPGGQLRAFCVSNKEYWDVRYKPKDEALPTLQLSGVLELRKHCIAIVAESQLRIATIYIRSEIPALLSDVGLWVQSGDGSATAEQKRLVHEAINTLENLLNTELSGSSSGIHDIARSFKRKFMDEVYERRDISGWTRAASNAGYVWSEWYHSTYAAFCRNNGDYSTPAQGSHNWNEEAISQMTQDLTIPWRDLLSSLYEENEATKDMIENVIKKGNIYLQDKLSDNSASTKALSEALSSRGHLLMADIEDICEKFQVVLNTLRTDALSGIRSSNIAKAMQSSYTACNRESGRGSDTRRKGIINGKLSGEMLFLQLTTTFKTKFASLADKFQTDIQEAVDKQLNYIRNTLDIVRSDNIASESEQDPEFRSRVESGTESAKTEIQRIIEIVS